MSQLKSLEVSAQQAVTKLVKVNDELAKTLALIASSAQSQGELVNQIAQKEAELQQLEVQFAEKQRAFEVKFDLDIRANQLKVVTDVLKEQGKTVLDSAALEKLRSDYVNLSNNYRAELDKAIAEAKQSAEASKAAAINVAKLQAAAENAATVAQVTSLQERNTLLQAQVDDLQEQIREERLARVEEAKARGNAVVNVQSGK